MVYEKIQKYTRRLIGLVAILATVQTFAVGPRRSTRGTVQSKRIQTNKQKFQRGAILARQQAALSVIADAQQEKKVRFQDAVTVIQEPKQAQETVVDQQVVQPVTAVENTVVPVLSTKPLVLEKAEGFDELQADIVNAQTICADFANEPIVSKLTGVNRFLKRVNFSLKNPIIALRLSSLGTVKSVGDTIHNGLEYIPSPVKSVFRSVWGSIIDEVPITILSPLGVPGFIAQGIWSVTDKEFWMKSIFNKILKASGFSEDTQSCLTHAYKYFFSSSAGMSPQEYVIKAMDKSAKNGLYNEYVAEYINDKDDTSFSRDAKKDAFIEGYNDVEKQSKLVKMVTKIATAASYFYKKSYYWAAYELLSLTAIAVS